VLFCTFNYLVFFLAVLAVYWAMPWRRARVWLLLGCSYYFYACWNHWLALLITVSTLVDYCLARAIDSPNAPAGRRKFLMCFSISANLGLLCYFKYKKFFIESAIAALQALGLRVPEFPVSVLLVVGISFYTFEAINYIVDVYQRKMRAERDLGNFMLFILFFPHLVAGPIVRARDFLAQARRRKHFSWLRAYVGAQYIVMGLFKKALADRMSMFADPIFGDPNNPLVSQTAQFSSVAIWLAVIAYAIQIYCDFSGYTDIAIGCAHMLGYRLTENFNMPYLSLNISEFWRRWHISLSSWLRDYLFIPLGGSRGTEWKICRNLMITMILGGLWHGEKWTFIVWGVLHGLCLVVHRSFREFCKSRPRLDRALQTFPGVVARMALTFLAVCAGWVFFRSASFGIAAEVFYRLVVPCSGAGAPMPALGLWLVVAVVAAAHFIGSSGYWKALDRKLPTPALGLSYAVVVTLALLLAPSTAKPFIYFQF
jgi:alginate O-acetyltransferase complex protein AlgI